MVCYEQLVCCERLVCFDHARKADLSQTSLLDYGGERKLGWVILCPSCKRTLDPVTEQEYDHEEEREPGSFQDEYEFDRFIRDHC